MWSNPFDPADYQSRTLQSSRDALVFGVDGALLRMTETFEDITESEFHWEPLSQAERIEDMKLPSERRRVWRVFETPEGYTYDYADGTLTPSPFTTIAWIMNHIAQTADMYLYCIQSGKPVGEEKFWSDLIVYDNLAEMRDYAYHAFLNVRSYLVNLDDADLPNPLNRLTPAPWGEMRPAFLNLWGGVIEHGLQHAMQIAVRKEMIRNWS